jgi:hypothetical protein
MISSLKDWYGYFAQNSLSDEHIPWHAQDALSEEEKNCIGKSMAAFQLGESSDGKGLLKSAEQHARKHADLYLVKITKLFIGEEQNHARLLKRFMTVHGIKLAKKNWTDTVFRRLRKNVGFELSITVLITAEVISLVYYRALKDSTHSNLLKKICDKILADEAAHVTYESELINMMRDSKRSLIKHAILFLHKFLFFGTLLVVYANYKRVLNRGGYSFTRFWKSCWFEFSSCFTRPGYWPARLKGEQRAHAKSRWHEPQQATPAATTDGISTRLGSNSRPRS